MYLKEIQAKGIFRTRIELAKAFVQEKGEDPDPDLSELAAVYAGEWIQLREPRGEEVMTGFNTDGSAKAETRLIDLFPDCLIDWSFKRNENEKASKEEVLTLLKESSSVWLYVIAEWGKRLPLARKSGRASVAPLAR